MCEDDVAQSICHTLLSRRDMLDEYFSLQFDDEGNVASIPVLLPGYRPNLEKLPLRASFPLRAM